MAPVSGACVMDIRHSRFHELTPRRSIQSAPPYRRQAEIEPAQIVLNCSQPGLPPSTSWWWWWWWVDGLCSPALTAKNSHERADGTIWWGVRFSDHDGTRTEGGSCVTVLVANSTRMVLPQQSCEDRIGLSLWLELQDHHASLHHQSLWEEDPECRHEEPENGLAWCRHDKGGQIKTGAVNRYYLTGVAYWREFSSSDMVASRTDLTEPRHWMKNPSNVYGEYIWGTSLH